MCPLADRPWWRGKARATVATAVMPVLEASGAIVELRETERVGHGEEIVRTAQLQENHIIAVCSGVHHLSAFVRARPHLFFLHPSHGHILQSNL